MLQSGGTLRNRSSWYPCLLPLVACHKDEIMLGRVPLATAPDSVALAPRFDGSASYGDLVRDDPAFRNIGALEDYLVWWDRPLEQRSEPPASGGRLVISAHPDDVEFSMGGWLVNRRGRGDITHVICFSELDHTVLSDALPSACEVTAVRRAETSLAASMLGLYEVPLGLPDFGLRSHERTVEDLAELEEDIAKLLKRELLRSIETSKPAEIFAPAAIGNHPDHRLIFDLILDLFDSDQLAGVAVHLYEDVPYAAAYGEIDRYLARFENSYLAVTPWLEEITDALDLKQTLCDVYRSQASPGLRDLVGAVAMRTAEFLEPSNGATGPRAAERFWTLADRAVLRG